MRNPLDCTCVICTPWREALDAECAKHEKEVADLRERISDLVAGRKDGEAMSDKLRRFVKEHDLSGSETMVHILDAEREAHEMLKMKYAMMEKFTAESVERRAAETDAHAVENSRLRQEIADLKQQLEAYEKVAEMENWK
jgi:cell division septum initiation protein DivIVA